MSDRVWLLGAADPEMEKIEALLRECGEQYMYALDEHGERVHSGNAYRTAVPDTDINCVICVECAIIGQADDWIAGRVDHHRPGDPGYGRQPSEFLPASSIGQVIARLSRSSIIPIKWDGFNTDDDDLQDDLQVDPGSYVCVGSEWVVLALAYGPITLPREVIFTAAADHCLGAAYQGKCPGVNPDELMKWRVDLHASYEGCEPSEILADIARARDALRSAPVVHLGKQPSLSDDDFGPSFVARDLRGEHIPELPEAAARDGECFLGTVESPDGRTKVVCQVGSPDEIRAFMEQWAPQQGLVGIYGDPERGFAGGYNE
jgi:hypothetical protein